MSLADEIENVLHWQQGVLEQGRGFITLPSQFVSLERYGVQLASEIENKIRHALKGEDYLIKPHFIDIPKKNKAAFRQVPIFSLIDESILTWAAMKNFHVIRENTQNTTHIIDHSRRLPDSIYSNIWINDFIEPYRAFRNRENSARQKGRRVLCLDIKNFGPSVDLDILKDIVINHMDGDPFSMEVFMQSTRQMQETQNASGIPIGTVSTDLFLKAYLHPFDVAMQSRFHDRYFRYVDDMRFVLDENEDLNEIIHFVEEQLSSLGLSLNADKTEILMPGISSHPDKHIVECLQNHGIELSQMADGAIDRSTLKPEHLRFILEDIILPYLGSGASNIDEDLLRQTYQLMGDMKLEDIIDNFEDIIELAPNKARFLKYYVERGNYEERAMPTLIDLCSHRLSGFDQYDVFKMAMRFFVKEPEKMQVTAHLLTTQDDIPEYMRIWAFDVLYASKLSLQPIVHAGKNAAWQMHRQ